MRITGFTDALEARQIEARQIEEPSIDPPCHSSRGPSFNDLRFKNLHDPEQHEINPPLPIKAPANLKLTNAVNPSDPSLMPEEGFILGTSETTEDNIPLLNIIAAASAEKILPILDDLILAAAGFNKSNSRVDILIESIYTPPQTLGVNNLQAQDQDFPILKDRLKQFEDLLLNDGFTGITIVFNEIPVKIQLDTHKLLIIRSENQDWALAILRKYNLENKQKIQLISEVGHIHHTNDQLVSQFDKFCFEFGVEEFVTTHPQTTDKP